MTLEIATPVPKKDQVRILKVLEAFGISASFKDDTEMQKEEFINKIEEARNGKFVSVTKDELKNRLGV